MTEPQSRQPGRILTVNTGSSSLKAALFEIEADAPVRLGSFAVERLGSETAQSSIVFSDENPERRLPSFPDHASALGWVFEELDSRGLLSELKAVGHRVVHGGRNHSAPELVSQRLIDDLREMFPIDPDHLPQAVGAIEAVAQRFPALPQAACFDSHFHAEMPDVAKLLPLPRWLSNEGVRRYGFHGLSYESIMEQLERIDPDAAAGKILIAHLGAGASMVAVRGGRSIDTTMGLTPTGGLMMGTRPGDLDPGVLLYLLQVRKMPGDGINRLLNRESGLLGVSGTSQDMRDLLRSEETDGNAAEAVELFCHIAKKHLAGLVAVLGGLDTLIFTGGIGEYAAPVRQRICGGLTFLGISIDPHKNDGNEAVVSTREGAVTVRVMKTDEELTVARHTMRMMTAKRRANVAF